MGADQAARLTTIMSNRQRPRSYTTRWDTTVAPYFEKILSSGTAKRENAAPHADLESYLGMLQHALTLDPDGTPERMVSTPPVADRVFLPRILSR